MEKVRLGSQIKQIRGVSYKPTDLHNDLNDNSVILLRANNISDGKLNFDDVVYVDKSKVKEEQYLKKGDILVCASSGSKELVGKAAFVKKDFTATFGAFCKLIRPMGCIAEYLGHYFNSPTYREKISVLALGANINNIRNEHIDELFVSSLNGYFNYIERYDLKVKNLKVQRQIFCQSEKELTKAEYERLLKAAKSKKNERLYLIMQTICATGIRVSELKYVDVNSVMTGQAQVRLKGKIRMILLPKELCQQLKKYIKEKYITSGSVFVTRKGQPVDRHAIWKSMKQLCETAGVSKDKVFPHNLRHLFARTYYSLQKDIVRLADILGHSNVNTTRIYTIENGSTHRRQMQRMGLVRMQN